MKSKTSGNGVTVANRFQIVRTICGKNYWDKNRINRLKSSSLIPVWDYKAEGLNLEQAKAVLINAIDFRAKASLLKSCNRRPVSPWSSLPFAPGHYLSLFNEKKKSIANFTAMFERCLHVNQYSHYNYGKFNCQCRTLQLPGTNTPYPVIAGIHWDEETDWDYYAKSYGRPKNTYSNRRVVFRTIGKLGQVETIYTYPLTSFAGNFMEKAIAAYLGITKVKCPKELKPIQLADYFTLTETKAINGYRLFERHIGSVPWDHAILDTKTGTTYHANEIEKLIPGLRNKLQAKLDHESEIITAQTGFDLGFCETGMINFCEDNSLDFNSQYSRSELRNIIIRRRTINYHKYRIELAQIGIHITK